MLSDARNTAPMKCDCCSKCAGSPHFMKLASSNSGLNVYQHVMNHGPTHIITFIFHNTTDNAIKPEHFSDLEPKAVECPRCRHNLAHAHKLLKEFPQIDRQGIVGVCQQCKPKREPDNTCKECLIAIQRFKSALDQRINTNNVTNTRKGYLANLKGINEMEMNNFKRIDTIGADPHSGLKSRIYDSFKDLERQSVLLDKSRGPHADQFHSINSPLKRDYSKYSASSGISRDRTLKDQRSSKSKVDKRTRSKKAFIKPSSTESNINKYLGKVIKGKGNTLNEYYFPKTTGPRQKINKLKKHISSTEVIDRSRDIIKKKDDNSRNKHLKEKSKKDKTGQKDYKEDYSSPKGKKKDTEKRKQSRKHSSEASDASADENVNVLKSAKNSSKAKKGIGDKKYGKGDDQIETRKDRIRKENKYDDEELDGNENKITGSRKKQEKRVKKGTGYQTHDESDISVRNNDVITGKSGKVRRIKKGGKQNAAGDISFDEDDKEERSKKGTGDRSKSRKRDKNIDFGDDESSDDGKNKQKKTKKNKNSKVNKAGNISSDEDDEKDRLKNGTKLRNEGKKYQGKLNKKGKNTDLSDEDNSDDGKSPQKTPKKSKKSKANKTGNISFDEDDEEGRPKKGTKMRNEGKSDDKKSRKKGKHTDLSDEDTSDDDKSQQKKPKKSKKSKENKTGDISFDEDDKEGRPKRGTKKLDGEKSERVKSRKKDKNTDWSDSDLSDAGKNRHNKLQKSKNSKANKARDISSDEEDKEGRPKRGTTKLDGEKSERVKSRKKDNKTDWSDSNLSDAGKNRHNKPQKSKNSKANKARDISSDEEDKEGRPKRGTKKLDGEKSEQNKLRKKVKNIDLSDSDTSEDGKNKLERGKKGKGKEDDIKNKLGKEKNRKEADLVDKISKDERKQEKAMNSPNKGKKLKSGDAHEEKSKRPSPLSPEQLRANIAQKDKMIADTLALAMKAKKDIIFNDLQLEKKEVVPEYKEARIPKKGKDIKEGLDIKYTIISEMIDTGEMTEQKDCNVCAQIDSVVEFADEPNKHGMAEEQSEIIIENKIYKYNPIKRAANVLQVGGHRAKDFTEEDTVILNRDLPEGRRHPNTPSSKFQSSAGSSPLSDIRQEPHGVINFSLSDRSFIDKGWTQMPTEKVVRKMNVYRMRAAHPQLGWFEHYRGKGLMQYPTGEKLAEFDEQGRGRWFYRNGRVALDYYDAEELNAQHRVVVYSSGESDTRGRSYPVTILATFDYLGNGIVFDHAGKIRLKYNQSEGVVLDRSLGPVSTWKWHSLNDPPVLQRVMLDNPSQPDPDLLQLADTSEKPGPEDEEMLALEYDNFIKDKSRRSSQKFKPFQIKMKALKVNDNFSLRVLDQATVYLIFRDGTTTLKVNLGMLLDHEEIIDVETAEVGNVQVSTEKLPGTSGYIMPILGIEGILEMVEEARQQERVRLQREDRLRPPVPRLSLSLVKPHASRTGDLAGDGAGDCQRKVKPASTRVYYNTNT